MRCRFILASFVALVGCAGPLHLRPIGLDGNGRKFPELFLGGWDGHGLEAYPDILIEPGVTRAEELDHTLSHLSDHDYAVLYFESAKLTDEEANPHGLFCDTPTCIAVLQRKGAHTLAGYGAALAIFELKGAKGDVVGSIWIDGKAIRDPGPKAWKPLCRTASDKPHQVHPDGNAWFPARESPLGDGFALFGPGEIASSYRSEGFAPPDGVSCAPLAPTPDFIPPASSKPVPIITDSPNKSDGDSGSHHKRKHKRSSSGNGD